jgi:hypothetical protein
MLTQEFISGFVSALGSFLEYRRGSHTYYAFQIKSSPSNHSLLDQIATSLNLNNRVYIYNKSSPGYSLLIVRDRHSILTKIIPVLDNHLVGEKALVYEQWKNQILENCSTWNYRNIKSTGNPQLYRIDNKNPNKDLNYEGISW